MRCRGSSGRRSAPPRSAGNIAFASTIRSATARPSRRSMLPWPQHRAARKLVIDLRDTASGGNTTMARAVLGWFVTRPTFYQVHNLPAEERSDRCRPAVGRAGAAAAGQALSRAGDRARRALDREHGRGPGDRPRRDRRAGRRQPDGRPARGDLRLPARTLGADDQIARPSGYIRSAEFPANGSCPKPVAE